MFAYFFGDDNLFLSTVKMLNIILAWTQPNLALLAFIRAGTDIALFLNKFVLSFKKDVLWPIKFKQS